MTASHLDSALTALTHALGEVAIRNDPDSLERYGQDWTRFHQPAPIAVAFPENIAQVQQLVNVARSQRIGLVPSGGRTGLSAGAVALNGELVVSFEKMRQIRDFNPIDRTVVCEAGVVTEVLQTYAAERGLHYPVDFAAAGSSQIGGNIATNAGGINVIRHGMTRAWVAGLKVVTGSGAVLELNRGLVKNNTGYDLRHLFIGSEGTLGFIVEATMRLTTPPAKSTVLVLAVPQMSALMEILATFRSKLHLNAFEFFSESALAKVVAHADVRRPVDTRSEFYALIEFEHPTEREESIALELFEHCLEAGWAIDGVMSQSRTQAAALWRCREDISETISRWTPYKNDIAVTPSRVPAFLAEIERIVSAQYPELEIVWFGHIGDGNLHLNILKPEALSTAEFKSRCDHVSQAIFDTVTHHGGSISAEHGIGLLKKPFLGHSRSELEIAHMKGIKAVFDPDGIMNPGKLFD